MCQFKNIAEMGCKEPFALKVEQLLVNILRKLRIFLIIRKIRKYITNITNNLLKSYKISSKNETSKDTAYSYSPSLKPGNVVRVRSKEQILQTLDKNNKLEGCVFMNEMWQYCGSEQRVLKRVDYFFDEAKFKMRKIRNTVLLENLHCSGKIAIFKNKCDRHCFYFWKEIWLEKIE